MLIISFYSDPILLYQNNRQGSYRAHSGAFSCGVPFLHIMILGLQQSTLCDKLKTATLRGKKIKETVFSKHWNLQLLDKQRERWYFLVLWKKEYLFLNSGDLLYLCRFSNATVQFMQYTLGTQICMVIYLQKHVFYNGKRDFSL